MTTIPPEIANLVALESLNLSENSILNLPKELTELIEDASLEELNLTNNPCLSLGGSGNGISDSIEAILSKRSLFREKSKRAEVIKRGAEFQQRVILRIAKMDELSLGAL